MTSGEEFFDRTLNQIPFDLTCDQVEALQQINLYLEDDNPFAVFVLGGFAGTGKTALLAGASRALLEMGVRVRLLAPTGRAARVLSEESGFPAHTIHRTIYRNADSPIASNEFKPIRGAGKSGEVFIVDEASMIGHSQSDRLLEESSDLLDDLISYVLSDEGAKLIFVGDHAQLPPVGCDYSPAMNPRYLQSHYGLKVYRKALTEVVRQGNQSDILVLATYLRNLLRELKDNPDARLSLPIGNGGDVIPLTGDLLVDSIEQAYKYYGREAVGIISYSNKRALEYNLGVRSQVLYLEEDLVRGDRIIVSRNNYAYAKKRDLSDFLANGESLEILRLGKSHHLYDHSYVEATVLREDNGQEIDVVLLKDLLISPEAQLTHSEREKLLLAISEDYFDIDSPRKKIQAIKTDRFFSALEVKYAYCLTCHKAQGGQWPCVYVDLSILSYLPVDANLIRWLYTAVTRASERLYLINSPSDLLQMIK